jgi:hypothetical protein
MSLYLRKGVCIVNNRYYYLDYKRTNKIWIWWIHCKNVFLHKIQDQPQYTAQNLKWNSKLLNNWTKKNSYTKTLFQFVALLKTHKLESNSKPMQYSLLQERINFQCSIALCSCEVMSLQRSQVVSLCSGKPVIFMQIIKLSNNEHIHWMWWIS